MNSSLHVWNRLVLSRALSLILLLLMVPLAACGPAASPTAESINALTPPDQPARTADPTRPNIVFIMTDDQPVDTVAYMPVVQAELVDKGLTFTQSYVTSPICCPSRTSILRGQYIHNHQVLTNYPPLGGFDRIYASGLETSTVATWLQAAGYRTALIGKYANRYPIKDNPTYVPPGWDNWQAWGWFKGNVLRSYYVGFTLNENGTLVNYPEAENGYTTDVFAAKTVEFINQAATDGTPFMVMVSLLAPHAPVVPAARHASLFADTPLPALPSFDEPDVSDKPRWIQEQPRFDAETVQNVTNAYRDHLRALQAVDEAVGNILTSLETTGLLENTYVIFYSDNGLHLGAHRLPIGKGTSFSEDVLVPLIVRGPGVPPDTTSEQIVANIDLAPTFADLAGATVPDFVDGRSLVPLLGGNPAADWRQELLISYICPEFNGEAEFIDDKRGEPCFNSLRTATYAYTHYPVTNEQELYNLVDDPYQLENLANAGDPVIQERLTRYDAAMRDLLQCEGEACRQLDVTLPE